MASVSPNDIDVALTGASQPLAASTDLRHCHPPPINNRLLQLLTSFTDDVHDLSFGLVPKHLMESSTISANLSFNLAAVNSITDPSRVAGDASLTNFSADCYSADDVFVKPEDELEGERESTCERQAGDGKEEQLSAAKFKFNSLTKETLNTISTSAVVFCDDQISARSSTSDSGRRSEGDRVSAVGTEMFSKLFRRYSFDLSAVASSPVDNFVISEAVRLPPVRDNAVAEAVEVSFIDSAKTTLMDTRFLRECSIPSDSGVEDGDFETGSFVAAESALGLFEKDEEVFKLENAFIVSKDQLQLDEDQGNTSRQSWLANENNQDITRPSWLTACEEGRASRVSIGAFLRAKTEDLGTLSDVTRNSLFEFQSTSPNRDYQPLSVTNIIDLEKTCDVSTDSFLNSMSKIVADTSLNTEPSLLIAKLKELANERKTKRANESGRPRAASSRIDPSGASEQVDHVETRQTTVEDAKRPDDWVILRSVKNTNKGALVSLRQAAFDVDDSPQLRQQCPKLDNMFSVPPITLHLLRSNSLGRRPSLEVPTNLIFSEPCVTGASVTQCLPLQNTSTLWMEGTTEMLSLNCDGRPFHPADSVFTFDVRWTVEPAVDKLMTVKFSPPSEGKWTARIKFSCRQISSAEWHVVSLVSLEAIAERPHVELYPVEILEFGRLPEESLCSRTLNIVSKCKASIPVRLVIEGESRPGQGFYFASTRESSFDLTSQQIVGPSEIVCMLNGSKSVVVHLKTPSILPHEDEVQVLRTNLRVDLDCAGSVVPLATLLLRAIVGVLRLYTPQDVEPIPLKPAYDLPMQNRGPVPVHVELCTGHPDLVSIMPSALLLEPGQQSFVRLTYNRSHQSQSDISLKSVLQMRVVPEGPCYEMHLVGLNQTVNCSASQQCPPLPPLLNSDRRNVLFSTVSIDQTSEKTITLHNASTALTLSLRLHVLNDNRRCNSSTKIALQPPPFYVVLPSANAADGFRSTRLTDFTLRPDEKLSVVVCYAPTSARFDSAALVIKQNRNESAGKNVKFTVPLFGYGGAANVTWDGVDQTEPVEDCDWVVNRKTSNGEFSLTARNRGQRLAFVRILYSQVPSLLPATSANLPPLSVRPSHFVLLPGGVQHVTVTVSLVQRSSPPTFYLGIFDGDEILRQRFRLYCRSSSYTSDSSAQEQLERVLLHDRFVGEVAMLDGVDQLPPSRSDYHWLVANMKTRWVTVLPSLFVSSPSYQEEPSRIFRPMVPEQTFGDATAFSQMFSSISPPTRDIVVLKVDTDVLNFPTTKCGTSNFLKVTIRNPSIRNEKVDIVAPSAPFSVKYSTITLKQRQYLSLPVVFHPQHAGSYSSKLFLRMTDNTNIVIHLSDDDTLATLVSSAPDAQTRCAVSTLKL